MPDDRNELLDAVDALTKPIVERITQEVFDDDGKPNGTRKVKLAQDPLLVRLQEAITSSISRAGGGGADKHARNILDSDALFEFMRITATITDWCAILKVRATRDATRDLRLWYVARLASAHTDDEFYIRQLRKWAGVIRAKLNKPLSWEVPAPCPECHYSTWIDVLEVDGHEVEAERNRPVFVEYWPDADNILESARGECRRCAKQWKGSRALRELRFDIDQAEARKASGTTPM